MGAGTGSHHHRLDLGTSAGDELPTARALALVREGAAAACADRAAIVAWTHPQAAREWIELVPMVGLAVLAELCRSVGDRRLARCLGLDPLGAPRRLADLKAEAKWPADVVARLVAVIGSEG